MQEFAKAGESQATLKKSPDDPAANLAVGLYRGPMKGDFKAALPLLRKSRFGGWQITGGVKPAEVKSQQARIDRARRELNQTGGGELLIKGRDGQVRDQNTIGKPDPRKSKG